MTASFTVAQKVETYMILPANALMAAQGTYTGQNIGAGCCTAHVRCVAMCLIFFASYFPLLGLFQGADNALYSTFVAGLALAVRVAFTYILREIPAIGYQYELDSFSA